MEVRRGDIYFAYLNPFIGSEQGGCRPVVVVQNDAGNKHSPTIIVALATSRLKQILPTHVKVCENDNLTADTIIMTEQLRTIDKQRIRKFVGRLSDKTMEKVDEALKISLEIKNTEKKGELMETGLQVFNNDEIGLGVRAILNDDGSISINAEDTAIGFGWTQEKNGKIYVKWERVNGFCQEFGFSPQVGKDDYIPESLFYRLGMKANNPAANKFQNWLATEVIPSIRKTGSYQKKMTPEDMMRVQLGMIDEDRARISKSEERISRLEGTMNIDYSQQRVLEKEVAKVVIEHLGGKDSPAYQKMARKVFAECNHDVKDYFHVNSRNNIPRIRFDDAVEYIRNWEPCTNTKVAIRETAY